MFVQLDFNHQYGEVEECNPPISYRRICDFGYLDNLYGCDDVHAYQFWIISIRFSSEELDAKPFLLIDGCAKIR
jgi:hypothetical protein